MQTKFEKHLERLVIFALAKIGFYILSFPIGTVIIQSYWGLTFVEYGHDWLTFGECMAIWFALVVWL